MYQSRDNSQGRHHLDERRDLRVRLARAATHPLRPVLARVFVPLVVPKVVPLDHLSKPQYIKKYTNMNTLNETFKNGAAIMSLIWSVGKMQEWVQRNQY